MKKKLLLIALIMATMLVGVFAISASAAQAVDGIYYNFSGTNASVATDNKANCQLENVVIPEKVTYNGTEYTVTSIESKAFGSQNSKGGSATVKTVSIPATVTSIGSYAFGNCPEITTVICKATNIGERAFFDCNKLTTLKLENTVQIGAYAFTRVAITSVVLPATVTNSGTSAFKACNNLKKIVVLGSVLTTNTFESCTGITELVLTENIQPFGNALPNANSNIKFVTFYTGSNYEDVEKLSSSSRFTEAGNCDYKDYKPGTYSGNMIVYNCNLCVVAFDNVHTVDREKSNDCVELCAICGETTVKHVATKNMSFDIEYDNFGKAGTKISKCLNDGCSLNTTPATESTPALFDCLGYSVGPDGRSLKVGFMVNVEALEAYKEFYPSFVFGIVMANADTVASNDSFFVDGTLNSSAKGLVIPVDGLKYANLTADAMGFSAEIADSLELVVGIYAKDAENNVVKVCQYENADKYTTTKIYKDMTLNAITFNQVRVGHGYEALVPQPVVTPTKDEQ